jgi:hypothetical protein
MQKSTTRNQKRLASTRWTWNHPLLIVWHWQHGTANTNILPKPWQYAKKSTKTQTKTFQVLPKPWQ